MSMIRRRDLLKHAAALPALTRFTGLATKADGLDGSDDRRYWVSVLTRLADPILLALKDRRLRESMPVEQLVPNSRSRAPFASLEAMGRLLAGIAPWLELGPAEDAEGTMRARYASLAREALDAASDPGSADYMNFSTGDQPLVDAAFLALGILRAPNELWGKLDGRVKRNVIAALGSTRGMKPAFSNWLLFSATIEAGLLFMGAAWDRMRVDYAVRVLDTWYKGDGIYGDGPDFHWDYYNSFVIHPMLINLLEVVSRHSNEWQAFQAPMSARAARYAAIQERTIAPDGTFPVAGRSICYRFGAFHHLADSALRGSLPAELAPEQVRCALTAVMRRTMEAPGTFDRQGWLTLGLAGHQPELAEEYISTGSCYLCATGLLPLGLTPKHPFWLSPARDWTSRRAWAGGAVARDHAVR